MICTAPCLPKCQHEATTELLSLKDAHLGFNCDAHIKPLRFEMMVVNGASLNAEYKKKALVLEK